MATKQKKVASEAKTCAHGHSSVKCIAFHRGLRLNSVSLWKGTLCSLLVVNDKVKVFNYKRAYLCRWNKKFHLPLYVFLINLLLRSTRRSTVDHKRVSRNRFYTLTSAFSISHDNIDTVEGKVFEYIFSVNSICHTLMILPNTSTDKLTSSLF